MTDSPILTRAQWLNLLTTREEHREAESRAEHANADRTEAKDNLTEARETLDSMGDEIAAKCGDEAPAGPDGKRLMVQVKAVRAAHEAFEMHDRRKRQADDLAKKMLERTMTMLDELGMVDEHLPRGDEKQQNAKDAWRQVELRNLMGDLHALPFEKAGLRMVGEAKDACEKSIGAMVGQEGITQAQVDYLLIKLHDWLGRRGVEHKLPPVEVSVREALYLDPPAPPKPPKAEKQEAVTDGNSAGKPALPGDFTVVEWSEGEKPLPLKVIPNNQLVRRDFLKDSASDAFDRTWAAMHTAIPEDRLRIRGLDEAAAFDIHEMQTVMNNSEMPTLGALVIKFEKVFEQRDKGKIFGDIPTGVEWEFEELTFIGDEIAAVMHRTGSPRLYQFCDHCIARCEEAFDDMFADSHLMKVARRPDEQRFGRGDGDGDGHVADAGKKAAEPDGKKKPAAKGGKKKQTAKA